MGSNPCRIIPLLSIAHPVEGKIISSTEGSPGIERIRGLGEEEMAMYGLVMCLFLFLFCKI